MTLTFSGNVTGTGAGTGGFVLTASGGACTLTVVTTITTTITFTISRNIGPGETMTLAYTPGTVVGSPSGNPVSAFSGFSVTNGQGGGQG